MLLFIVISVVLTLNKVIVNNLKSLRYQTITGVTNSASRMYFDQDRPNS